MNTEKLLNRVNELIELGNAVLRTERHDGNFRSHVDQVEFFNFRSASISFTLKLFGRDHPYFIDFSENVTEAFPSSTKRGIGMLKAAKTEIEQGWLISAKGLISSDIFGDFLEMADHLLEEGYKDPAAVIVGSALEQHLKGLCQANGVETTVERNGKIVPKKADVINSDLVKEGVYTKLDQKSVTFWLDIRNNAAHGNFEAYNSDQVRLLLSGVSEFMGRTSDEL